MTARRLSAEELARLIAAVRANCSRREADELIGHIEALEAELRQVHTDAQSVVEDARVYGPDDAAGKGTKITFGYERLCERVSAVLSDRDRLRAEVERLRVALKDLADKVAKSNPAALEGKK